jgi:hypothetical protein
MRIFEKFHKEIREHPDFEKIHYILADDPRLEVMSKVLQKSARRKLN